ncbi:MAG TPA: bifunctional serine/threonine-protein kinase/universal stress protein [Patescibacteria group bacterium]|nr:bifunctional serine/threonine-protein kinase/universal stress protein [Patescibacteria group bacterium]
MSRFSPGTLIDGFRIGDVLHAGGMGIIHAVTFAEGAPDPGFPMVMKLPRFGSGDGAGNIVGYEVEQQMLQAIASTHVPRFVAAGDLTRQPYLVMERIDGRTLDHWLQPSNPLAVTTICELGSAIATAAHHLHQQNACHLDLKPGNVMIRADGQAVLLDLGLACHAHYPDLLAEETRRAIGSPPWIAPEQVVGVRGDPRSDVFAIGVILYELATRELPFGIPQTEAGMRQRLWMDPRPPRQRRPDLPEWFQEIVLRCLEPEAARRYPSAAHLAFDLKHPQQVTVTARGRQIAATGALVHLRRWLRAAGKHYAPSPLPIRQIDSVPILMVAIPHRDVTDATLYSLREAVARSLGIRPGARLACVTVVPEGTSDDDSHGDGNRYARILAQLRQWASLLDLSTHQASYHVLESGDVADALLRYADANQVSIIVMGAATHGKQLQRLIATVPIKVAMAAPCTVILVKQTLPFERLSAD